MATTRIIPMHWNRGRTLAKCIRARTDYAKNPEKTEQGRLVTAFACNPDSVDGEFLLSKLQYQQQTGRTQRSDVIAYQVRQSFAPGTITPEEANQIGYEFAERFTKGKHAFLVATHTDRNHIHNHIIWNSTSLDCQSKFRDFFRSGRAVRELSDVICVEHGLSIIEKPEKRRGKSYNQWQQEQKKTAAAAGDGRKLQVGLLMQIEEKIRISGGYARWASVFNAKQLANTINYLHANDFASMEELLAKTGTAVDRYNELNEIILQKDCRMKETSALRTHIINYAKTRETFQRYKASHYSRKFLSEHESEILLHRAAKNYFNEHGLRKLPGVKQLNEEYTALLSEKRSQYPEFKKAREEMRNLLVVYSNVERILNAAPEPALEKAKAEAGLER